MKKGIILYGTHYGFTRRYAEALAEATGLPCLDSRKADRKLLADCAVVVHGGGLYAGGVCGLSHTLRLLEGRDADLFVFTVGLADPALPENTARIREGLHRRLPARYDRPDRLFHLRGGVDYPRMKPVHRAMMAMLRRAVQSRPAEARTAEDQLFVETYGGTLDFFDVHSLAPLTAAVRDALA